MDPISAAAGAIAFVQAATAIAKGVALLRSLENAPTEFHGLLSELQALQTVVSQAKISATAANTVSGFQGLHDDLSQTVNELDVLSKRLVAGGHNDENLAERPKISRIRWRLERDNIYHLRDRARSLRGSLSAFLAVVNAAERFVEFPCVLVGLFLVFIDTWLSLEI